jgi:excisionase family DNA binding protein
MEGSISRARERRSRSEDFGPHIELLPADLSPRAAARQTGLSRTLIYREIERGRLRAYKVGGRLRITLDALAEWKLLNMVAPRAQPPAYEPIGALGPVPPRSRFTADVATKRRGKAA